MRKLFLILSTIQIISCSGDSDEREENIEVFRQSVNVLCGSGVGQGYAASEQVLAQGGVDVIASRCSYVVDGDGFLDCTYFERINIHEIRASNLPDATDLGYQSLENLSDDYDLYLDDVECS